MSKEMNLRNRPPFRPRIYIWNCDKRERDDTDFSPHPINGKISMGSSGLNNAQDSGSCESMDMSVIPVKSHPFERSAIFFLRHKRKVA